MSTGLYTHRTRFPGELVTATMYNTAHKNHLTNDIPTEAGAVSDDLTQYQTTVDPFPGSVATPVVSMGEEIEQLRFVIQDIKNFLEGTPVAQWYSPVTTTFTQDGVVAKAAQASITTGVISIPDTVLTPITFDQTDYDTGVNSIQFWSGGSPTKLTAPVTGLYDLSASINWFATSTPPASGQFYLRIRLNGVSNLTFSAQGGDGVVFGNRWQSCDTQMQMTAGDYVEMVVEQSEAGGAIWEAHNPQMTIVLISSRESITAPPTGVTVHFKINDAPPVGGVVIIDDGTGPISYPVVSPTNDNTTLQTSVVTDGQVVTYEVHNLVAAPYCADPGQSFSIPYSGQTITNCGSGWAYKAVVTVVASEANPGDISWTSHS